jgi:A/G-specific adenine glycosylase
LNTAVDGFAAALVHWQRASGRHELPWQNTTDAYRIWLSEIMLQQTQVAAVIPYYGRFLERFPDVFALAAASDDAVMQCWSGLGYYSRARNLHACARRVVGEFAGVFPTDPAVIASLPGIGRSTAAAIAVFSAGVRAAILDGNVKRVLSRMFAIEGFPGERAVEQQLWALAEQLLPAGRDDMVDYTQGLMDLGATLCKPKNPSCLLCPMRNACKALALGKVDRLPTPKVRTAVPERSVAMLVLRFGDQVLLEKRPPLGIWGGLWSLPELPLVGDEQRMHQQAGLFAARFGVVAGMQHGAVFVHGFTHFRLTAQPVVVALERLVPRLAEDAAGLTWTDLATVQDAGLPAPVKKYLIGLVQAKG